MSEVPTWDDSLAPEAVRRALGEFYGRQQSLLSQTLGDQDQNQSESVMMIPSPAPAGEGQGEGESRSSQKLEVGLAGASLLIEDTRSSAASEALRAMIAKNTVAQNTVAQNTDAAGDGDVALSADTPSPQPSLAPRAEWTNEAVAPPEALKNYATTVAKSDAPRSVVAKNSGAAEPQKARVVAPKNRGPSPWVTLIKPVLHESLGWFLGAFLILAGALYLIADAWGDMTSTTRALTVFGLVEVWAVGFALWAAALSRKPTTRGASASLRRIAALVAPLSVLALGPALSSPVPSAGLPADLIAWVALAAGSGLAAFLTLRAAKDLEEPGSMLGASVLLSTVGVGLAPILPVGSGWGVIIPSLFAAWGFARGPRSNATQTWTAALAWLLPLALVTTRFLLIPAQLECTAAGLTVATALLCGFSLKLAQPEPVSLPNGVAPGGSASRAVISVVSLTTLFVVFLVSLFVPRPANVVVCLLAAYATFQHAQGGKPGGNRIWWLSGTY
ncbi:MAG: hypothetical protein JNM17_25185, partial [Archangium sp.]|nr:hypothetical protein [Archangium sp.]